MKLNTILIKFKNSKDENISEEDILFVHKEIDRLINKNEYSEIDWIFLHFIHLKINLKVIKCSIEYTEKHKKYIPCWEYILRYLQDTKEI